MSSACAELPSILLLGRKLHLNTIKCTIFLIFDVSVFQWVYSKEGFLKFLVESRVVYNVLEEIVQSKDATECKHKVICPWISSFFNSREHLDCAVYS